MFDSFWNVELPKLGYAVNHVRQPLKDEGILVGWKKEKYTLH